MTCSHTNDKEYIANKDCVYCNDTFQVDVVLCSGREYWECPKCKSDNREG